MKYINNPGLNSEAQQKIGVLITNLGTPDAPSKKALKPYLKEFLSDPRVVEVPRVIWSLILNLVILQIRPARSAEAYQGVWTERGSPLLFHTEDQAIALQHQLSAQNIEVAYAMRYGNPNIESAIDELIAKGVGKLLVFPLYPQYCAATSASTFDAIASCFQRRRWFPELRFINQYYQFDDYISTLANHIKSFWDVSGKPQKLIFSYHGVPQKYVDKGDPYQQQCFATSERVAKLLGLKPEQYMSCFQSRFGREPWLQPYTDETLKSLPKQGVTSVQVVCPGFSADCLETIEEIGMENRDYFLEAGGNNYQYIPALNAQPEHIKTLKKIVELNIQGW
ncbi:ferrochelatase [Neptunicella marina]|uniref:Ferrochelatase n=1 Tax=Neptunicella marina TaxID=2125989 RepID=A0A8J6ITX0_9ALTE|nr:ferrochelatase [Neptunicella marina]MBC3765358.1 ferrochelatase [Neptunicella marina]